MIATQTDEVLALQKAGRVAAKALKVAQMLIKPGMSTLELDKIIQDAIFQNGCLAAFKGYQGFNHASCISINAEVVHGVPSAEVFFQQGDLVSIDTGAICDGYYSDTAISFVLPPAKDAASRLVKRTEHALKAGIAAALVGNTIGDISRAIQQAAGKQYCIIKGYTGHSLGKELHELPQIPNEILKTESKSNAPFNIELQHGMILAIEPMLCEYGPDGYGNTFVSENGWTVITSDGGLAAHFEHTIMVTTFGPVILTEDK